MGTTTMMFAPSARKFKAIECRAEIGRNRHRGDLPLLLMAVPFVLDLRTQFPIVDAKTIDV
jgi:hypothetical protein